MNQPQSRKELLEILTERTSKSGQKWESSQEFVPGGLLSVARRFKPYPFYTSHAEGAYLWDIDGNRYIDCSTAYGVLLLGHRPPIITEAILEAEKKGTIYCTPHELELAFCQRFIECIPCAERVLLCNTGTEATMQGIRIMRAYTGKDKVAKLEQAYHGWHDYVSWNVTMDPDTMGPLEKPNSVPTTAGMPEAVEDTVLILPFDESAFGLIAENAGKLAGVMVEPVMGQGAFPLGKEFLEKLQAVCKEHDVLLMFDEVKTGFRMALGGAQEYWDITPDLASYGKVMGGGLPGAAVGCKKEIAEAVTLSDFSISVAGTYSGNPMSLATGYAMLGYLMENRQIYEEIERRGDYLRNGFNQHMQSKGLPACMTGIASFFETHMKPAPINTPRDMIGQHAEALYDMQLYLRYNGVHCAWFHDEFISAAHDDAIMEEVLHAHIISAESAMRLHGLA